MLTMLVRPTVSMYGLYTAVLRAPPPHHCHRKITVFRGTQFTPMQQTQLLAIRAGSAQTGVEYKTALGRGCAWQADQGPMMAQGQAQTVRGTSLDGGARCGILAGRPRSGYTYPCCPVQGNQFFQQRRIVSNSLNRLRKVTSCALGLKTRSFTSRDGSGLQRDTQKLSFIASAIPIRCIAL